MTITADNTGGSFPTMASSPAPQSRPIARSTASGPSKLKARPVPSSTFNSAAFAAASPPTQNFSLAAAPSNTHTPQPQSSFTPLQPTQSSFAPLQPMNAQSQRPASNTPSGPNYNISLSPQPISSRPPPAPSYSFHQPTQTSAPIQPSQPAVRPPPGWSSGIMQPTVAPKTTLGGLGNQGWDDFDPLK